MTTAGRGAWTRRGKMNGTGNYARIKGRIRDGVMPTGSVPPPDPYGLEPVSDVTWFESVRYGVMAIQSLLNSYGFDVEVTGEYRTETRLAVVEYQANHELFADGIVGQITAKELLRPVTSMAAATIGLHPKWLWGLGTQESGFDLGAQGWTTNFDYGWQQHNTSDGEPSIEEAFDPEKAALMSARRFVFARDETYSEKGHQMAIDCAIMQHRSPVAAKHLYDTGEPLGPESEEYVSNVHDFAMDWYKN